MRRCLSRFVAPNRGARGRMASSSLVALPEIFTEGTFRRGIYNRGFLSAPAEGSDGCIQEYVPFSLSSYTRFWWFGAEILSLVSFIGGWVSLVGWLVLLYMARSSRGVVNQRLIWAPTGVAHIPKEGRWRFFFRCPLMAAIGQSGRGCIRRAPYLGTKAGGGTPPSQSFFPA